MVGTPKDSETVFIKANSSLPKDQPKATHCGRHRRRQERRRRGRKGRKKKWWRMI